VKKAYLFLSVLLFIARGFALGADTTYVDRNHLYQSITYFKDADYFSGNLFKDTIENSLHFFHQYNPALTAAAPYKYLGNLGSAYQNMLYQNDYKTGILTGFFDYNLYQSDINSIRYFSARKRYSDLRYVLGAHLEQRLNLTHSQNINPFWNVALHFQRISSDGAYTNLFSEYGNVDVSLNGRSKNKRYLILSNFIYNRTDLGQNGGLVHDPAFENATNTDGLLYPIQLQDGRTHNKSKGLYVKQQYNFGYFNEKKINDSTSVKEFQSSWGIMHSVLFEDKSYGYKEATSSTFYPANYYIQNQTNDSTFSRKIENQFGFYTNDHHKRNPETLRKVNAYIIGQHQLVLIKQRTGDNLNDLPLLDTTLSSTLIKAAAFNSANAIFNWNLSGSYASNGINKTDYLVKGFLNIKPKENALAFFRLSATNQKQSPAFIFNKFYSNHFIWNNHFNQAALSDVSFSYQHPKYHFDITAGASFIKNYLYFGLDSLPKQQFHTFSINTFTLHKDFTMGPFIASNKLIYQHVQRAGTNVINLPAFIGLHSFYYQNNLFSGALPIQLGFDLRYNSKYFSDGFMPATGRFFVQNKQRTGEQFYIDVFVNFQIKTARMFIKVENVNAPSSGYSSNMAPTYPIPGRTYKFGISWQFYD
jgi:hypothetical protein